MQKGVVRVVDETESLSEKMDGAECLAEIMDESDAGSRAVLFYTRSDAAFSGSRQRRLRNLIV